VRAIESVGRVVFEEGAAAVQDADATVQGRSRRTRRPVRAAPAPAAAQAGRDDALYSKQRFVLEFQSGEAALCNILNRLASDPMFAVVTGLKLEKKADDVAVSSLAVDGGAQRAAAPDADAPAGTETPPRRDRVVSGPERDVPLSVRIELDVYRFREE
jgi:hypothetical protein